ncbi:MAG: LysR substrate-binding domain-containing protein [Sedimentitalea sp.]|uniref:LysR substrate-binding domain-containing protein n=1 Tax=Sedimentitalea sp. TaxID=2048915 RepID=UPI0032653958
MGPPDLVSPTSTVAFHTNCDRPLALPRSGHDMCRRVEEVARNAATMLNAKYEAENINLLDALIGAGLACGIQPISYWLGQIASAKLVTQKIISPTISRVHSLCWLPDIVLSPATEAIRDIILAEVAMMISGGKLSGRQPRLID